jgi:YrbI family 3-deoxy-D-manno-octulosonate 8-phosphate phosphatase
MVNELEVLAVVPARGGSKSIPKKNIKLFAGYPLLAYSIAAALQASHVNRVIVSTNDENTAEIARRYGAEVPMMRPTELALDSTPDLPVFEHLLSWLEKEEAYIPDMIVQLRPTTPLRPPDCVDRGIAILQDHPEADSVRAVIPSGQNPYKMWRISDDGRMSPLLDEGFHESYNMPRQALPNTYWQTGHLDVFRRDVLFEKKSLTGDVILPLIIDPGYTVDIDNTLDWERAEWNLIHGDLKSVRPGHIPRPLPEKIELVVLDFDGVFTDNRVWTNAVGEEFIAANRGDGWGIARLKEAGFQMVVLSTEVNPVVAARCHKLNLEVIHGIEEKDSVLTRLILERDVDPNRTIYLGNDVNDIPCFPIVGCALVVADAHPEARAKADLVLQKCGGFGAVRELSDLLISRTSANGD